MDAILGATSESLCGHSHCGSGRLRYRKMGLSAGWDLPAVKFGNRGKETQIEAAIDLDWQIVWQKGAFK